MSITWNLLCLWVISLWSVIVKDNHTQKYENNRYYTIYFLIPFKGHNQNFQQSLLDKMMSQNQWHIGVHQHHLMFKGHWRAPHETIYGHKKKVCLDKTFPLGHFMLHFIMFLICQLTINASSEVVRIHWIWWQKLQPKGFSPKMSWVENQCANYCTMEPSAVTIIFKLTMFKHHCLIPWIR